jgi:hypothetical protein
MPCPLGAPHEWSATVAKKHPNLDLITDQDDPVLTTSDLKQFGVDYHVTHLRRLWKQGKFPQPFKLSANRLGWRRSTIRRWLAEREQGSE